MFYVRLTEFSEKGCRFFMISFMMSLVPLSHPSPDDCGLRPQQLREIWAAVCRTHIQVHLPSPSWTLDTKSSYQERFVTALGITPKESSNLSRLVRGMLGGELKWETYGGSVDQLRKPY